MFKLAAIKTVEWPVAVDIPGDGGRTTKATFTASFEVLEQSETTQLLEEGGDIIARQLTGWKGVQDEEGNDQPFSDEAKTKLLGISYVRAALFRALAEINSGRAAARKN